MIIINDAKSEAAEEVKAEPEKIDFSKVRIEPLFEEEVWKKPQRERNKLL